MKKTLVFSFFVLLCSSFSFGQSGFVVAGNNAFSVGQMFATPYMSPDLGSVSPGIQNANVITVNLEDDGCEGYDYTDNGFNLPAAHPTSDTVYTLVNYDPDVRSYLGYDSITNLSLTIHATKHSKDTTIFMADYDDPRFGTDYGHIDVTYHTSDFGCDSVVDLLVYRMTAIPDEVATAGPGYYTWPVTVNTPSFQPEDFYEAGGTLTPSSEATYTNEYPTGETTPVVWTATIADSTATFTQQVTINEPDCSLLNPVSDGSSNTYEAVRLIHDCWL